MTVERISSFDFNQSCYFPELKELSSHQTVTLTSTPSLALARRSSPKVRASIDRSVPRKSWSLSQTDQPETQIIRSAAFKTNKIINKH